MASLLVGVLQLAGVALGAGVGRLETTLLGLFAAALAVVSGILGIAGNARYVRPRADLGAAAGRPPV
ncbi:MAG TPA: hypothetical protein VNN07_09900 [Candidatus Tectomicrobia bacterium]|nr:hypothetical protein [Candidatus Tectomicrobia bacterium]